VFQVILKNRHICPLIKVNHFPLHLLTWSILIIGVSPRFRLRGDLVILFSLWTITVVILGFIFYSIGLNSLIFTRISTKWCKLSFLVPLKLFVQIMQWNTTTSRFLLSYSKMGQSLISLVPTPHNKLVVHNVN